MKQDNSLGSGVYYAMSDYAGFLRRLMVIAIDTTVLVVAGIGLWIAVRTVSWNIDPAYDPSGPFFLAWLALICRPKTNEP